MQVAKIDNLTDQDIESAKKNREMTAAGDLAGSNAAHKGCLMAVNGQA